MKKVLFATTALIATAGMAAAEVKISGYGRFGLDYNEANKTVVGRSETNITSRLRFTFDASTETDGGVTVGARARAQFENRDGTPGTGAFNGAQFHVAYGGLRVNVGNIWGAIDNMPGFYLETRSVGIGIDGAGFNSLVTNVAGNGFDWDTYTSAAAGRNGIEALYSAGGFSGHLSYSQANGGTVAGSANGTERTAVHVAYTFGDWTAALGYQDSNVATEDKLVFTVAGDLGQFGVRLAYGNNMDAVTVGGVAQDVDKITLAGNVELGAASTLVAFVSSEDNPAGTGVNGTDGTAFGINYSYDLGGGVSFEAGAVESSSDFTTVQAGLYFSF
ncbi:MULTISPECIES: porin [unclassified Leisingera]|uniref:porin n=1 Tax=unclassified Leisingera TaxID=2614906 RepID=UPI0010105907|nr:MULTISPECIES: porin [unclassified Leisingera]MBQ4823922.1 porin [Leisingera sp. HS039]MCF6431040.1 porin [Leisingera sp. MMG026]QAX31254.1 porin [Leisingera sp. NJS204]